MCCLRDFPSREKSARVVLQFLTVTTFHLFLQVRPWWHPEVQKRSNGQQKVLGRLWLEWPGPNRARGLEVCDYHDEQLWQDGRVSEVSESWRAVLHLSSWSYQILAEGRGGQPRWFDANADGAVTGQYWTMFKVQWTSEKSNEWSFSTLLQTNLFRMVGRLMKTCHWDGSWNQTGQSILQFHQIFKEI